VNELANFSSNFRKEISLNEFLVENKIPGLQGINTRMLTKLLRESGVMKGKITADISNIAKIVEEIKNYKPKDPVSLVSTKQVKQIGNGKYKIALLDFGVKQNIVQSIIKHDATVYLFPSTSLAKDMLAIKPDGIVLSNGPGDPKDNHIAIQTIKDLYNCNIPILGICLGHQLLALATGADTKKLKYGHRGPNHPVKCYRHNRVYMTSQNHGYYIDEQTIDKDKVDITYLNVNDKTIEGLSYKNKNIETVQFHPEACAGPHDTAFIFDEFFKLLGK
jgi:carbamoyl-phosphate synthase small subunit